MKQISICMIRSLVRLKLALDIRKIRNVGNCSTILPERAPGRYEVAQSAKPPFGAVFGAESPK